MDCPSLETLLAYDAGELAEVARDEVARHLARGCDDCAEVLGAAREMRSLLAPDPLVEPPEWVVDRAGCVARDAVPSHFAFAELVFDAARDPLPLGARAPATGARHMLYRAADYEIAMRVAPATGRGVRITGQVMPPPGADEEALSGVGVALTHARGEFRAGVTDEMGEFIFDGVEEDEYTLVVEPPGARLLVDGLQARRGAQAPVFEVVEE